MIATLLLDHLTRRLPPAARAWPDRSTLREGARAAFAIEFAAATRRLGRAPIDLTDAELAALTTAGVILPRGLGLDELGRIWMLAAAALAGPSDEFASLVEDCYRHGENRERQSVLRALPLLPEPARFLRLAVDACRTHVVPIFEAVACENVYPAARFPELSFNQMALKALFLGVALDRIVGLRTRLSPDLERMARGFASERRAAGRGVPGDIERLYLDGSAPADRGAA